MQNDDPKDPLEGKGEEMVPDRGIPFDDIEESASQETSPYEIEEQDSIPEGEAIPEGNAPLEKPESEFTADDEILESEPGETPSQKSFFENEEEYDTPIVDDVESGEWAAEAQPVLLDEAEASLDTDPETETIIPFDVSSEDEAIPDAATSTLSEVPHPWEMSDEDVDDFIGDAEAAFSPPPDFEASLLDGEMPSFVGDVDYAQPPDDLPDEGMGTALE